MISGLGTLRRPGSGSAISASLITAAVGSSAVRAKDITIASGVTGEVITHGSIKYAQ